MAKVGRKQRPHVDSVTGDTINGLSKMPDGRWRIIGTQTRFAEPDEQKAITRYRELTGQAPTPDQAKAQQQVAAMEAAIAGNDQYIADYLTKQLRDGKLAKGNPIWKFFGEVCREHKRFVADATGIEELGYLTQLQKPETPPTFDELEKEWKDHYPQGSEERRKTLHAWAGFKKATGIESVADITEDVAIRFRDDIWAREYSPKSQQHIFTRIRRLVSFIKDDRRRWPQTLTMVQKALSPKILKPNDTTLSIDPKPIPEKDFHALLRKAKPFEKALMLVMLNGGYYCREACRLKWSNLKFDGDVLISHRKKKTKVIRVCVLWDETKKALAKMPKVSEYIFHSTQTGTAIGHQGAERRWRRLRKLAKKETITLAQFRDGASQAMADAGINALFQEFVMGHRTGEKDHYIVRTPKQVEPACQAIYKKYFTDHFEKEKAKAAK